ncbi:MAG: hypothetical protein MZV63_51460 [Marinilabiliales bacterium]|nr:hypothetical protein [Marinilabiliales bacterium]
MDIAQQLSSLVMKADDTTKVCYKLKYNSPVGPTGMRAINLSGQKVRSAWTALASSLRAAPDSASEVVINSLKPYVNVTIIGDTTHGKPAGMNIWGYPFPSNSNQVLESCVPVTRLTLAIRN